MKINNLNVDTQALANGLYKIICAKGEESIVAFGMIPKWIMDLAEKLIREKIISEAARQVLCTPEQIAPVVDNAVVDNMTRQIIHEICLGIYKAASDADKMLV